MPDYTILDEICEALSRRLSQHLQMASDEEQAEWQGWLERLERALESGEPVTISIEPGDARGI